MSKTIRPVLAPSAPHQTLADGTSIWGASDQPWAGLGIMLQYSSTRSNSGQSVHVASEAVDSSTGEVLASTSHPACTKDAVRKILANRNRSKKVA